MTAEGDRERLDALLYVEPSVAYAEEMAAYREVLPLSD